MRWACLASKPSGKIEKHQLQSLKSRHIVEMIRKHDRTIRLNGRHFVGIAAMNIADQTV
jgi:hypothetical protein